MATNSGLTPGGASYPLLTDPPHPDNIKEPVVELDQRAPVIAADIAALNSILDEPDRTDRLGWLTNTNELVGWDGDEWLGIGSPRQPGTDGIPYAMAAGSGTLSISGTFANTSVNFPASRFTQTPIVTVSLTGAPGGSQKIVPRVVNPTTSGFSVYFYTGDYSSATATNVPFAWQAIQMKSDAAAG